MTTTDELIPSGETSSYRSNPLGLAEFALSRKDPEYVGRAKEVQAYEKAREEDTEKLSEMIEKNAGMRSVWDTVKSRFAEADLNNTGIGSAIFAVKPGDGSARE